MKISNGTIVVNLFMNLFCKVITNTKIICSPTKIKNKEENS